MKRGRGRGFAVVLAVALGVGLWLPIAAQGDSANEEYLLLMEAPNIGVAPNGDTVAVTGEGEFAVNPKEVSASGAFTHFNAGGAAIGGGTWMATQLISFHPYGCGVVFGDPIPANLCGGAVKMRVTLTTAVGTLSGVMTVFCIIGDKVPASHADPDASGEGVTLDITGVINFNHTGGGENVYIRLA